MEHPVHRTQLCGPASGLQSSLHDLTTPESRRIFLNFFVTKIDFKGEFWRQLGPACLGWPVGRLGCPIPLSSTLSCLVGGSQPNIPSSRDQLGCGAKPSMMPFLPRSQYAAGLAGHSPVMACLNPGPRSTSTGQEDDSG